MCRVGRGGGVGYEKDANLRTEAKLTDKESMSCILIYIIRNKLHKQCKTGSTIATC